MLSDQLKEDTKQSHQTLEKRLVAKIRATSTPGDYVQLLRLFWGFYNGLEERIAAVMPDAEQASPHFAGRKSSLILDDIACFVTAPPYVVPATVDLPEILDQQQAMGALYVLEGSTLGGRVIAKMIGERLGLKGKRGLTFFEGYGDKTWKNWEAFKRALDILPRNPVETDRVIASANETFSKFNTWVDRYESENQL
ncbi:biliverdin-producing heme oxygenase [Hufsiella ginkgonis]|uniref:Biliverdin-producing heme oxygenase n=1 Tax=Hufsiella ginkgonis TaxID=2695274 RepID=A0A7K1Y115_9SPHI|nr:biliverdin-producing heme oxygenase [Hufsiella ginkgonis]MXV16921.1 hypothetical protein [Hufsiella ginkgonis]